MRTSLLAVAALVIGFVFARLWTADEVPPTSAGAPSRPSGLSALDLARLRAEVRAAVDERLPAEVPPASAGPTPAPAATPNPDPVDTDRPRLDAVDSAIASGRWTEADERNLRLGLAEMSPEGREQALSRFYTALNAGHLQVESDLARGEP